MPGHSGRGHQTRSAGADGCAASKQRYSISPIELSEQMGRGSTCFGDGGAERTGPTGVSGFPVELMLKTGNLL